MPAWLHRPEEGEAPPDYVGQVIREYRVAAGLSQSTVSIAMDLHQQHLSQMEHNKRPISLEQRRQFVEVLGIPPEELGITSQVRSGAEVDKVVAASRGQWRAQRRWLNHHRGILAGLAADLYPAEFRVHRTSLIAHPEWIPTQPVELDSIELSLADTPLRTEITGREQLTLPVRPLRTPETHFDSYTSAIRQLDPPRLFESRPSYRYVGGSISTRSMEFGMAAYFDKLDVSEALGHELAIACMESIPRNPRNLQLPFRQSIAPFDPVQRAIIPAITTLTIRLRRYPAAPSFLLHWRDPAAVATAGGVYDVIPAGEFQPSSVALWDRAHDFSLWRNMVREYSEELLGTPEHDGTRSGPIDYESWSLYRALSDARQTGQVRAAVLGMGVDALTLAATILTVVVIDDDVFTEQFGKTVRWNDEGEIVAIGDGRAADGIPFDKDSVARLLDTEPLAAPGAAALALAWESRDALID